jgi:hypothetical protein
MWNTQPCMSGSNLKIVSYALRRIGKALPEASHWQIIETYWNTSMQQYNILVHSIQATHKDDLERYMLKQRPTLDIPR